MLLAVALTCLENFDLQRIHSYGRQMHLIVIAIALVLSGCQTTQGTTEAIEIDASESVFIFRGLMTKGTLKVIQKKVASSHSEVVKWNDSTRFGLAIYHSVVGSNSYFDEKLSLQNVIDSKSLSIPNDATILDRDNFENAVANVDYGAIKMSGANCIIYSMVFGNISFVASSHPLGTDVSFGYFCQLTPITHADAQRFLSSFSFKGWDQYPERTAPYL